jgi:hypothetical protein
LFLGKNAEEKKSDISRNGLGTDFFVLASNAIVCQMQHHLNVLYGSLFLMQNSRQTLSREEQLEGDHYIPCHPRA